MNSSSRYISASTAEMTVYDLVRYWKGFEEMLVGQRLG
jgi:hypothetical protein